MQQIEIAQYWTFLGKHKGRLLGSLNVHYYVTLTGNLVETMIEKLLIKLHLKRRSNPKVEVEEDSDASFSLKHSTLMRFHALTSNFKLHLKMKPVFFTQNRKCVYSPP